MPACLLPYTKLLCTVRALLCILFMRSTSLILRPYFYYTPVCLCTSFCCTSVYYVLFCYTSIHFYGFMYYTSAVILYTPVSFTSAVLPLYFFLYTSPPLFTPLPYYVLSSYFCAPFVTLLTTTSCYTLLRTFTVFPFPFLSYF
jgi:hypothetical protein